MQIRVVTSDRLHRLLNDRIQPRVLDVRTREEFARQHLPGAHHIPFEELTLRAGELDPMVDLYVVSEHGIRSLKACEWLNGRGYLRVVNLVGGLSEFGSR